MANRKSQGLVIRQSYIKEEQNPTAREIALQQRAVPFLGPSKSTKNEKKPYKKDKQLLNEIYKQIK